MHTFDSIEAILNETKNIQDRIDERNKLNGEKYKIFKIDKELFVNIMQELSIHAFSEKNISDILSSNFLDNYACIKFGQNIVNCLLNILTLSFDPENKHDSIVYWWLYEAKNGEKILYEQDNTKIDLNTPEQLYDWLVAENKRLYE